MCKDTSTYYPLFLDIQDKPVCVIGAGNVALRKVTTLLNYGAHIHLIAPHACTELQNLAQQKKIDWHKRNYQHGDLSHMTLCFCACGIADVERAVQQEADEQHVLLNVVDVKEACDFFVPAVMKRGNLQIAISTSGSSPALAHKIKEDLLNSYDTSWEAYLDLLAEVRIYIQKHVSHADERKKLLTLACHMNWQERIQHHEAISVQTALQELFAQSGKEYA